MKKLLLDLQQVQDDFEWLTIGQAASRCGCKHQAMRSRVLRGTVISKRVGAHWIVRADSLMRKAPGRPPKSAFQVSDGQ